MRVLIVLGVLLAAACRSGGPAASPTPAPSLLVTATVAPSPAGAPASPAVVEVRYGVERRTSDLATFAAEVDRTLHDPRGWQRAGFRLVRDDSATYRVVLAEPAEAQRLCEPYDVFLRYSCQNGPVVVINAERWRHATPRWTGTLASYRRMLVNHEVGHLLGMHHPDSPCPRRGALAPVMLQQSTELDGCLPNPWPLPAEVARAARHDLPLAPPP